VLKSTPLVATIIVCIVDLIVGRLCDASTSLVKAAASQRSAQLRAPAAASVEFEACYQFLAVLARARAQTLSTLFSSLVRN